MDIPFKSVDEIDPRSRCGKTKHEKYGEYMEVFRQKPHLVEQIKAGIDKEAKGEVLARAVDVADAMGEEFKGLSETTIFWNVRFVLWHYGIFVASTIKVKGNQINPDTKEPYMWLRFRRPKPGDKLSEDQAKYLETETSPDVPGSEPENVVKCEK